MPQSNRVYLGCFLGLRVSTSGEEMPTQISRGLIYIHEGFNFQLSILGRGNTRTDRAGCVTVHGRIGLHLVGHPIKLLSFVMILDACLSESWLPSS